MRHNKKFNHLGRKTAHRKAMLSNMASSLIQHKRIATTLAKAKALQVYVEPLLTKSKEDTTHSRRTVFSHLQNKEVVTELFQNVSVKIANRPGGYTRILRTGFRLGDNAEMCIIELVDYNENMLKEKATKKAARTRRAGSAKKTETTAAPAVPKAAAAPAPVVEETPVVEDVVAVEDAPVVEVTPEVEEEAAKGE
jgi:large subunit ribosomal protein L17